MNNYTDNKKFWKTVKPLFSTCGGGSQKISLVKDGEIISDDQEVAEIFNQFFINSVNSLEITKNKLLISNTDNLNDPVEIALKKFEQHPSIIEIKEKVHVGSKFLFSKVSISEIKLELKN